MGNKYLKYLQLSSAIRHLNPVDSVDDNKTNFGGKYLSYSLLGLGLILWIIFNIVAIENYQFAPYPLVFMNIILYCIIAVMASPNHYSEPKSSNSRTQNEHRKG